MASCNNINIPLDLTLEILKKLHAKSLARFQCVSKQWISMIKDFIIINSIVTRSLTQTQPRDSHFIFDWYSYNSKHSPIFSYAYPHHQITNEKQLYCEKIFRKLDGCATSFQYVRGLIGSWNFYDDRFTIYNPTTKQSISLPVSTLPRNTPTINRFYLFGYDPLKNQYKVLCVTVKAIHQEMFCYQVFTLGDPKKKWSNILLCRNCPFGNGVCINGKIYYKSRTMFCTYALMSFDVMSQTFNRVQAPDQSEYSTSLLNYQGKLACICDNKKDVDLWVMEINAEKQEWFKITFFDLLQGCLPGLFKFADVTNPGGEIVFVHIIILNNKAESNVYYYDPKRNIRRRFEIQTTTSSERILGANDYLAIYPVTDHVENIMCL